MGWILELFKAVSRNFKTWMLMADTLSELQVRVLSCKSSIDISKDDIRTVKEITGRIDSHGSSGAMKAIALLGLKLDKIDEKLDVIIVGHGERLSRLEGIVINGHKKDN